MPTDASRSIAEKNSHSIPKDDSVEGQTASTGSAIPINGHANAEVEKMEVDQLWTSHTRAKLGKEKEVERDQSPSPSPASISINQDVGLPPTLPIATKPAYNASFPSLLTMTRPGSIKSFPHASLSSNRSSPYHRPSLETPSPTLYCQPLVNTSSSSFRRRYSLMFSHNNPNHPLLPEFLLPPKPVDGSEAYRPRYKTLQSLSHSQASAYTYSPSPPPIPAQGSNLIFKFSYPRYPECDQPTWKRWEDERYYAEHSDDGSESFSREQYLKRREGGAQEARIGNRRDEEEPRIEEKPIKDEVEDSRRSQWWRGQEEYLRAPQKCLERRPSLNNWTQINLNDEETDVRTQIQSLLRDVARPWRTVDLLSPSAEGVVMDVLQQELDDASCPDEYRTVCMKCLQTLSKARNIVPSSFSCRDVIREGENPIWGGGFSDIWKGRLHNTQVCLKVLRIFISGEDRAKVIRDFCREALVWRQLRHPNVLPFLGVSEDLFAPSYCLISPWMVNGNIVAYLQAHPDHDRLTSLVQVADAMRYLHNLDPPIVHADIRGVCSLRANILVADDRRCCLADFGLSLITESQNLSTTSGMRRGSLRWLAPEYILPGSLDQSCIAARDSYAYGCTVIEVFTGKPPFSDIRNDRIFMTEVIARRSRPPLELPEDVFPYDGLPSLVAECLRTSPGERPDARRISRRIRSVTNSPTLVPISLAIPIPSKT
ncbi:kinase-like protein [Armillaria gallica]|uniref:Kinase-like protein n=1 Tax=Armillaria gallica TaxID=47427 RepID=A0A2H3DUN3_ARMGA|nr:kinase-like protein [Armillaria gallica]